jgi:aryl-alcohol dehydrogenase-like predicted oxidoreductase
MNLSHAYGRPPSPAIARELLRRAVDLGVTHFDTAALYGFGVNEELIGEVLPPHRGHLTIATKGGMFGVKTDSGMKRTIDCSPASLRANCETSLRALRTDVLDLYYLHRWDKRTPIEESVGGLATLVKEGKIRQIGLSEVSAATLRRAHLVHPISAVQSEYSIVTRNPEIAVLQACREIGAAFVAFSPVGRGMFSRAPLDVEAFEAKDIRRTMPRFAPANFRANQDALQSFYALAAELGQTPAQLALVWLLQRGDCILPIPGTTQLAHLQENAASASIVLSPHDRQRLDTVVDALRPHGLRYNAATQAEIDTERWDSELRDA